MNRQSQKSLYIIAGLLVLALVSTALTGCQRQSASGTVNSTFVDVNGMVTAPTGIATSYLTKEELDLGNPNSVGVPQFLDGTMYTFSHDVHYEYVQLTAWDPTTGKRLWSVNTNFGWYVEPLVSDGKYLFVLDHSTVVCLDKTSGVTIWKNPSEAMLPFPFLALSGISMHINKQSHTADWLYILGEEVRYVSSDMTIEEKGQQGIWILDATTGKSLGSYCVMVKHCMQVFLNSLDLNQNLSNPNILLKSLLLQLLTLIRTRCGGNRASTVRA